MYIHGFNQEPDNGNGNQPFTWLDYIILSNPQGVMKLLSEKGYTGYLAPQNEDEMYEVCLDLMNKEGDQVVVDLLKSHPFYDIFCELSSEEKKIKIPFKNASGDFSIISTIKTINYQTLLETALIIIGALYLGDKLWNVLTKKDV
jgi:hypothetical protein